MVLAVIVTLMVVGQVGFLGAKMIDSEWRAGNVVLSWRAEAAQLRASRRDAAFQARNAALQAVTLAAPSESARQAIAQWQDIVDQIRHPYFKSQISILLESKYHDVPAPWVDHPIPLSQFAASNRPFLDTIYQRCPPLDQATAIFTPFGSGALAPLKELLFLDAAGCLHTGDRERFESALVMFFQVNRTYRSDLYSIEPLVCLLHRALDVNLLTSQEVEVWVDRLCKQVSYVPWDREQQDRWMRLQAFSGWEHRWSGTWVPPSIILAIENQNESTRQNRKSTDRWNLSSVYRVPAHKLALLGMRVALLNEIRQHRSLPKSTTELETTQVLQNVRRVIAESLEDSETSWFEYAKIGEMEGSIRTSDGESLWKGPYPVHESYSVLLTDP
jgi:hypothetical protein